MDYSKGFDQNWGHSLRSYYSSLEGATCTMLEFPHYVPIELCICMDSFFAEVKIFRLWPKTMDYSKAFDRS